MFSFWQASTYLSALIYGLVYNPTFLLTWLIIIGVYFTVAHYTGDPELNTPERTFRISKWTPTSDPTVHVKFQIDLENADEFLEKENAKGINEGKKRLTYTHIALKSLSEMMKCNSEGIGKIVFGKFQKVKDLDLGTLVNIKDENVDFAMTRKIGKMGIRDISESFKDKIRKLKSNQDEEFKKRTEIAKTVPSSILKILLGFGSFLSYNLGLDVKAISLERHFAGSGGVTNISGFKVYHAHACFFPAGRAVCVLTLLTPKLKAVVDQNGDIVVRKMVNLTITANARYFNLKDTGRMSKKLKDVWYNPKSYL